MIEHHRRSRRARHDGADSRTRGPTSTAASCSTPTTPSPGSRAAATRAARHFTSSARRWWKRTCSCRSRTACPPRSVLGIYPALMADAARLRQGLRQRRRVPGHRDAGGSPADLARSRGGRRTRRSSAVGPQPARRRRPRASRARCCGTTSRVGAGAVAHRVRRRRRRARFPDGRGLRALRDRAARRRAGGRQARLVTVSRKPGCG